MMIPPPSSGDPYQAAAALDRALRSPTAGSETQDASQSDSTTLESGPDIVVTLSKPSDAAALYNASGKFSGSPSLDDMGANAPDSMAKATESGGGGDASSDATPASSSASSPDASVHADEEATAAA